ncbi:MAG: hypothetical protein ACRD1R_04965 [Acidobacteriota bacterium]
MNRLNRVGLSFACLALMAASVDALADVKVEQKSKFELAGFAGKVLGFLGGKSAKEGVVSTVTVQDNRKASINEFTGEIIDLDEEKVYNLDMRKKSYTVTTFDELRRQLEKAQAEARKAAESSDEAVDDAEAGEKEYEIDFDLRESGQTKNISGYDSREVVMTITVREKGKELEESGGLVMTTNTWLAPEIQEMEEITEFDRRYAEKLSMAISGKDLAAALALLPGLDQAMQRYQAENVNLEGTPLVTVMTVESVKSQEQLEQEREAEEQESSGGGLFGGFAKKVMKKKDKEEPQARSVVMTINNETLNVSTSVSDAEVAIPAGFKLKNN